MTRRPTAGGTELLLAMKLGLASYDHLVDLKRVYGLRGIGADGGPDNGRVRIGAATTHDEIESSAPLRARYPEMSAMISQVANLRVRSVGKLGGNCASPTRNRPGLVPDGRGRDPGLPAGRGDPPIPAAEFLTGLYETALAPGELLVAVELPPRRPGTGLSHLRMKLTERPVVTVTALVTLAPGTTGTPGTPGAAVAVARLIVGSVASVPFAADTASLLGATPADFASRAESCAEASAAACTRSPTAKHPPITSATWSASTPAALGEARRRHGLVPRTWRRPGTAPSRTCCRPPDSRCTCCSAASTPACTAFGHPHAAIGPQPDPLGGSRVWVLPNPSGLNAHWTLGGHFVPESEGWQPGRAAWDSAPCRAAPRHLVS